MKKIITKISLSPLLNLFLKKKTVRSRSDIVVPEPPKDIKLKWKKPSPEHREGIKKYKVRKSDSSPRLLFKPLSDEQLMDSTREFLKNIKGNDHYPVPEPSLDMLNLLMTDFEFAMLENKQSRTAITFDHLKKARQAVVNGLRLLKVKYKTYNS